MDQNTHQGHYGEAFVSLLAAAAGLMISKPYPDVDGVDLTLREPDDVSRPLEALGAGIEVQVKTSSQQDLDNDRAYWPLALEANHYRRLLGTRRLLPIYLVLVVVPRTVKEYVAPRRTELSVSHSAYWMSLRGQPDLPAGQAKKTVHVPCDNLLTIRALQSLLHSAFDEVAAL